MSIRYEIEEEEKKDEGRGPKFLMADSDRSRVISCYKTSLSLLSDLFFNPRLFSYLLISWLFG